MTRAEIEADVTLLHPIPSNFYLAFLSHSFSEFCISLESYLRFSICVVENGSCVYSVALIFGFPLISPENANTWT